MKRLITLLLVLTLMSTSTFSADLKIGFIDSKKVMEEVPEFKRAQEKLSNEVKQTEQKIAQKRKEINKLRQELQKQKMVLTEEKRKKKEKKLREKMREYQEMMQGVYGKQGDLQKKRAQLAKPLQKKMKKVIEEISKSKNFDMILDAGYSIVLYGKKKYDLTEEVINELKED